MRNTEYYNVAETARLLHVHVNTVRNWCDDGKLPYITLPFSGYRRILKTAVDEARSQMGLDESSPEAPTGGGG